MEVVLHALYVQLSSAPPVAEQILSIANQHQLNLSDKFQGSGQRLIAVKIAVIYLHRTTTRLASASGLQFLPCGTKNRPRVKICPPMDAKILVNQVLPAGQFLIR